MNLVRLARMILVVLAALVAAVFVPRAYWLAFDVFVSPPLVYYSPVTDSFFFMRFRQMEVRYQDAAGKVYTRDEFEKLNPLASYRQLAAAGTMPDSLRGVALDLPTVRLNTVSMRIFRSTLDSPPPDLYPMFESQSGRVGVEWPDEMFRITSAMEFITAATNTIDTVLSRRFTGAMAAAGFKFPATAIAGNPTTIKLFDEGYFVTDAAGKVFHLKKVRGEPFCRNIMIPDSVHVLKIQVQEMPLREFYGILIDRECALYLISYDHYRLVRLPITGYDPSRMTLSLSGDLFFRTWTMVGDTGLQTTVTDRGYRTVAAHHESWPSRYERTPGVVASFLFPFTIELTDPSSMYVRPFVRWSGLRGLVGIAVALGLMVLQIRLKKQRITSRWFDVVVVACTGIFGLLVASFIANSAKRE